MKIRIWIAILDSGDGEHYTKLYPTKAALVEAQGPEVEEGLDLYGYPIEIIEEIINVNHFMMVED